MIAKRRIAMENSISRILIETVVRKTLKDIKESPERSIRNLVDMALYFSVGSFQQNFFRIAQVMLKNENSPYYALLRNVISSADTERLVCFGMNLGYNSYTMGAKRIRENEQKLGFNISWTASFQIDGAQISDYLPEYHSAITDGEKLGIYSWMLFATSHLQALLPLIHDHPDSAFFLFCNPEDISASFLDSISDINNLMLVIRYEEMFEALYTYLCKSGFLYSAYYSYSEKDMELLTSGDLFYSIQQIHPIFTVLLAQPDCSEQVQRSVHQIVEQARNEQRYETFPVEFYFDNQIIDQIISDDTCFAGFNQHGALCDRTGKKKQENINLFKIGLSAAFQYAYPKCKKSAK